MILFCFLLLGSIIHKFVQDNELNSGNLTLNSKYYDNVTWKMPYGSNQVIIDGVLNSSNWDEWSDAQVFIICFNYSTFNPVTPSTFAGLLYLKHNLTHILFALDVNWTQSLTLQANRPTSKAGLNITQLMMILNGDPSYSRRNATWDESMISSGYQPDMFLIYFDEMYNSNLDNLQETCVRANDTGINDGVLNGGRWFQDTNGSNVQHERGLEVFEIAVPVGPQLDEEDLNEDTIGTSVLDLNIGVLFAYGLWANVDGDYRIFDKGEPPNTYGIQYGQSDSSWSNWDAGMDGDPWIDSPYSTDYRNFDLMVQKSIFTRQSTDGTPINLIPGIPNLLTGVTPGGWLATTINISLNTGVLLFMNGSPSTPADIPQPENVASLFFNFSLNESGEFNAIIRLYFNVSSNGTVYTQTLFTVANMTPVYYNTSLEEWVEISTFTINEIENYIEFHTDHFSYYAIIGKETQSNGNGQDRPPIPGFEWIIISITLISLTSLYFIRKKREIKEI